MNDLFRIYRNLGKHFDFNAVTPFTIGLEDMFQKLEDGFTMTTYPPYNIVKKNDAEWIIEIAIAGFNQNQLEINLQDDNLLIVKGNKEDTKQSNDYVVFGGLAARSFIKKFTLGDDVKISDTSLEDGILRISCIKETKKSKVQEIKINTKVK